PPDSPRFPYTTLFRSFVCLGLRAGHDPGDVGILTLRHHALRALLLALLAALVLFLAPLEARQLFLSLVRSGLHASSIPPHNERARPREGRARSHRPARAYAMGRTFAACRPLGPFLTSNSTFCPSARERKPSATMAV